MLLVYTHQITPRLTYVVKHICKRILGIEVGFTSKVEDFIAHNSAKMSYSKQPLSNELHIKSHDLLFEQGLSDLDIKVEKWEDTKGFFFTNQKSDLPYDIFAASFYLLSRYEEYLPHVNDEYGRFSANESIAKKEGFLHQPIVDIWAYKLKSIISQKFPEFSFPIKKYSIHPVIDVPSAFYFKYKGFLRSLGGYVSDVVRFRFKQIYTRILVSTGFRRDPYDSFKWIINRQKATAIKFQYFFLVGNYSTYDKNVSHTKKPFISLIKSVGDYSDVGLKVSYAALDNVKQLKLEKARLEHITNRDLAAVRNSYSKLNLPVTYRNFNELEILKDFTMGYVNELGFRAGTCTPFQYYDLDYEVQTPLQINPYHCMDFALLKYRSQLDKKETLLRLINEIKKVDGIFVPVFHNYSLGNDVRWSGYRDLFNLIMDSIED